MDEGQSAEIAALTKSIGRRFHQPQPRTCIARTTSKTPIVMSRVIAKAPIRQKTETPPPEAAFSIHVHMAPLLSAETWINGRHSPLPHVPAGGICLFDLQTSPVALVHQPMDFLRIYIAQRTLDELAYERGQKRVSHLRAPDFGHYDPVLHSLAAALAARLEIFGPADNLFADYVALAFHAHLVQAYGEVRQIEWRGGLAPWQLRRACALMMDNLEESLTIADLAAACGVSESYFARAFRQTTGTPPHRWLMRERIERAKRLLSSTGLSLYEIASACGFADQSHFSRAFLRCEGQTPARWRRVRRH